MTNGMNHDGSRAELLARLAAIIETSHDAIVSKTLDGIVKTWNKGAERIFGWTAEEMIGNSITLIIPDDRQDEEPAILQLIRSGERVDHFETVRKAKDGRLIDVSVTISPILDSAGKVVGVSKIARDISGRKRSEEELLKAKEAAEEAKERAESASRAKDHFLSVLSHELRTPLTPALAAVTLLENDDQAPPRWADSLQMIRRNIETEARLVDDLLDLTRIAKGKIVLRHEMVDAHNVLRGVVSMFKRQIDDKQLVVSTALHAAHTHVWADPGRFQQIVLNLLSNAVKFTPAGGSISIRTCDDGDLIKIEIRDSGVGIEPDVLPKLFQPFEQGERTVAHQYGGLGLGLSIVKALAELHNAAVSAHSDGLDRGATFTIRIPTITASHGSDASTPENAATAAQGKRARLLLVEDHNDTRNVLGRLLTRFGYAVTMAASVREATEAAERQRFDLLLSDIGLPDGSGFDVMKHMAARFKTKGVAISGFGQEDDVRRSVEAGFFAHVTKPVNLQTLLEVIRNAVG